MRSGSCKEQQKEEVTIQTVNYKPLRVYKMGVQIPYRVLTKEKRREAENTENFLRVEKIKIVEVCSDHIHTLEEIPSKVEISSLVGYLKEKSSLMICEKYLVAYGDREFSAEGIRGCGRKECKKDTGVYTKTAGRKQGWRTVENGRLLKSSFTGSKKQFFPSC